MRHSRAWSAARVLALTTSALTALAAQDAEGFDSWVAPGGSAVDVHGTSPSSSPAAGSGEPRLLEYKGVWWTRCAGTGVRRWCADGAPGPHACADGSQARVPLFAREINAAKKAIGDWDLVDRGGCPEDGTTPVLTAEEFARLPLTASPVHLQPGDGRALVHYGVIATSDPTPQTLTTTILGTPITVTATPTTWTWNYGDGTAPRATTDPGHPYPDTTSAHPYDTPGTYQLTLTTTWSGTYQVNGTGPLLPVTGTASTTTAAITVTVETAHPHLVTGP